MSNQTHPGERLVDYVDGHLDEAAATEIRAHLEVCVACRGLAADLAAARDAAATLRDEDIVVPADLAASVGRALDAATLPQAPTAATAGGRGRWWAAAALAASLAAYFLLTGRPAQLDVPDQVARDLAAAGTPALPFGVTAGDAATLERYFADAGSRVRVIDLAMMDIVLEGGVRHTLNGRPSALYSYRTPSGARLVCQMYEGRLADLPPPAEVREHNGFRFQVYSRGSVTMVFWQEGELVCVLASELPAAEVVALAIAKAMV